MKRTDSIKKFVQRSAEVGGPVTLENLVSRCRAKEMTVGELAKRIGRARPTIYFALERPSRFSEAYQLIQKELNP